MKTIFETVIERGGFDLSALLKKIDTYHVEGKLTDEDREDLTRKARAAAKPENSLDLYAKVTELEARVKALEGDQGGDIEASEYVPGKWYYAGDKCLFGGKTYTCIAPEGVACVWSPEEYPAYWEES